MTDIPASNPYEPSSALGDSWAPTLTRIQSALLVLLALALILRGGLMALSWAIQLSSGLDLSSYFYAAIFTKDAIYCGSALLGGLLLLARYRIGWWSALVHWCWYIACEVAVVAAAAMFDWRIPVHYDGPALYRVMALSTMLATAGLAILFWRPITLVCDGPLGRRWFALSITLLSSVLVAFGVNGWMSLR
ncbi:hypothetical protein SH528x_002434 [Novipirellula sp. SH528]|uniref:hypothetical protein n=1 Tax=Novipirellula sp. SH528 TaxID=3454466 RepID=UPI003FA04D48